MKKLVLYIGLSLAIMVFSCQISSAEKVSVQNWQYYEGVVKKQLHYITPEKDDNSLKAIASSPPMSVLEHQQELMEKRYAVIDEIIALAKDGDQKALQLVEKLLMAEDSRLVKNLLIDGNPKLKIAQSITERLLAKGNPQLVKFYKLRPATVEEYREWLVGYLGKGGKITFFVRRSLQKSYELRKMFVARQDFFLQPQDGVNAILIIMPKGVNFLGKKLGGNTLLMMGGFQKVGDCWPINTYSDTGFE